MIEKFQGIKNIQIHARTTYPIVSAYEFEFLKSEAEIKALLKPCTIYFIIQRPLVYFNNLRTVDGLICFEVTDDGSNAPLSCRFDPSANGFCTEDEELLINVHFYKKTPDTEQPFCGVAAFKLLDLSNKFLSWFSPQKFIYEYLSGRINAEIDGNITDYIDYTVHYIGKAFSQDIWDRLTGHHKMQSILTIEDALNTQSLKAPFEIALLMLEIDGFDEMNFFPFVGIGLTQGVEPILHELTFEENDDSFDRFYQPKLAAGAKELTTEVEAMLVDTFKPKYNEVLFENYPHIKTGTRSAGYTESTLLIEKIPAILKTDNHTQGVILPR